VDEAPKVADGSRVVSDIGCGKVEKGPGSQ
jgi:hypothetical protein